MTDLLRPDTAPVPAGLSVSGYVCVGPDGEPFWLSAHSTAKMSMLWCFTTENEINLDQLARDGWRCVPITLATPAPHPADPPTDGTDYVAIGSERHFAEATRADDADRDGGEA